MDRGYYCDCPDDGTPSVCTTECGDDVKAGEEACDNVIGCTSLCTPVTGYTCSDEGKCLSNCGDGILDSPNEACDNGLDTGCSEHCVANCGWDCSGVSEQSDLCQSICGDGEVVGDEICDHWGTDNMGCSEVCTAQDGYNCVPETNICSPECGDGIIVEGIEECDFPDHMTNPNPGCSSTCLQEENYRCYAPLDEDF